MAKLLSPCLEAKRLEVQMLAENVANIFLRSLGVVTWTRSGTFGSELGALLRETKNI